MYHRATRRRNIYHDTDPREGRERKRDLRALSSDAIVHVGNDRRAKLVAAIYFVRPAATHGTHGRIASYRKVSKPGGRRIFKQLSFITLP